MTLAGAAFANENDGLAAFDTALQCCLALFE
jgi:hypothetical protein